MNSLLKGWKGDLSADQSGWLSLSNIGVPLSPIQRKHQAMYDDFVKRKDMKREGYPAGSLHSFTANGGNTRYTLPVAAGGGAVGAVGNLEGGVGGGFGTGVAKFDRHDPRQVCVVVPSSWLSLPCGGHQYYFASTGSDLGGHSKDDCARSAAGVHSGKQRLQRAASAPGATLHSWAAALHSKPAAPSLRLPGAASDTSGSDLGSHSQPQPGSVAGFTWSHFWVRR